MGGCASRPNTRQNSGHKRKNHKSGKRVGNITTSVPDLPLKRFSNAGNCVEEFTLSDFILHDFEKGASAPCLGSEASNMKFHVTQLQYQSHNQVDANGTYFLSLSS